ncbi:hypothetical protein [Solimonas sp. SE-A11]|uniref:hypothetical protein n=1 Tax=Solimonas sp. SE-A11 TaxID=3054954 RepID=UPI00259CC1A2|nr:hypothetical protein [Solimonas sp. SE-A11]MDM4770170.1 hypothetical protein [Solimonas sp. SE-A11]
MNIRNLLLAASLAVVSSAAFAGKAPTTLGGFQSSGSVVITLGTVKASDAARNDKDAVEESKKEEK